MKLIRLSDRNTYMLVEIYSDFKLKKNRYHYEYDTLYSNYVHNINSDSLGVLYNNSCVYVVEDTTPLLEIIDSYLYEMKTINDIDLSKKEIRITGDYKKCD